MGTEEQLIKSAKNKDKQALHELYKSNFKGLYIFIRSKVDTNERAEDICSEAFIKAFENIDRFEERSSFKSWLYTIGKNLVYDWYAKKGKEVELIDEETIEDKPEVQKSEDQGLNKEIVRVLELLKDTYRQVLELRFLSSMTIKDVALVMNTSEANVKTLQRRALKKAKQLYLQQ